MPTSSRVKISALEKGGDPGEIHNHMRPLHDPQKPFRGLTNPPLTKHDDQAHCLQ
jgi:hypothetical protein